MKSFLVIGLGRFGRALAVELFRLGHEVLAIDASEEGVQQVDIRRIDTNAGQPRKDFDQEKLQELEKKKSRGVKASAAVGCLCLHSSNGKSAIAFIRQNHQ